MVKMTAIAFLQRVLAELLIRRREIRQDTRDLVAHRSLPNTNQIKVSCKRRPDIFNGSNLPTFTCDAWLSLQKFLEMFSNLKNLMLIIKANVTCHPPLMVIEINNLIANSDGQCEPHRCPWH